MISKKFVSLLLPLALTIIGCSNDYQSKSRDRGGEPVPSSESICSKYGMEHGLFSIRTDGSDLRLHRPLRFPDDYPEVNYDKLHVSLDGKRILYLRCESDRNDSCQCDEYLDAKEVVYSDFDGAGETIVSRNRGGFNDYPNWSPDGRSIVFMNSEADSAADLYRFDLETQVRTQITVQPMSVLPYM